MKTYPMLSATNNVRPVTPTLADGRHVFGVRLRREAWMLLALVICPWLTGHCLGQEAPAGMLLSVGTIEQLRKLPVAAGAQGRTALVGGFHSVGDGGGGMFVYDAAAGQPDNGGTVLRPAASGGRWLRNYSGALNVRWFGAKQDGATDDTASIQAAINTAAVGIPSRGGPRGTVVSIPAGVTRFTTLTLLNGVVLRGEGQDQTILQKTSLAASGIVFDSTVAKPTGVIDRVEVRDLSIYQIGKPTAGAGILLHGVSAACQVMLENIRVQNCHVGVSTFATIGSVFKSVQVFYSYSNGFEFSGRAYMMSVIDCYAGANGQGGFGSGFVLNDGNYCTFYSCGSDANKGYAYHLKGSQFCSLHNCGNEENTTGAYLQNCIGNVLDVFFTAVSAVTTNAVKLEASSNNELRNLASGHRDPKFGTHMVSAIRGSANNRLSVGYTSNEWPGGVTDNGGAFSEIKTGNVYSLRATLDARYIRLTGAALPAIDGTTSLANAKRILAIYSRDNAFTGIGMDSGSFGVRLAGDSTGGVLTDVGFYSLDGKYDWTSRLMIGNSGIVTAKGPVVSAGNFATSVAGATLAVKSGVNAKAGTFSVRGGTALVENTSVTPNSVIMTTVKVPRGRNAPLAVTPTPGRGFSVAGVATDDSTYNYVILEVN